uniref:Uncharacterized protein n=1 Tax=Anopheles darlingi TaxID=43151 RepID=A0A2M4D3W8_ANODA
MCFRIIVFIGNFFGCVIETTNPDRLDDNAFGRRERKKKRCRTLIEREIYMYIYLQVVCIYLFDGTITPFRGMRVLF